MHRKESFDTFFNSYHILRLLKIKYFDKVFAVDISCIVSYYFGFRNKFNYFVVFDKFISRPEWRDKDLIQINLICN